MGAQMMAMMMMQKGGCGGKGMMGGGGYGKGGGKPKKVPWYEQDWGDWKPKPAGAMPDIVMLELPEDSKLIQSGLCQNPIPVIEHEKLDIFSESHYYLQDICGFDTDIRSFVNFEHAAVDEEHPEILRTWKGMGKEE